MADEFTKRTYTKHVYAPKLHEELIAAFPALDTMNGFLVVRDSDLDISAPSGITEKQLKAIIDAHDPTPPPPPVPGKKVKAALVQVNQDLTTVGQDLTNITTILQLRSIVIAQNRALLIMVKAIIALARAVFDREFDPDATA